MSKRARKVARAGGVPVRPKPAPGPRPVENSRERKWWETWWGTSVILTVTGIVAGLGTEYFKKPDTASPTAHFRSTPSKPNPNTPQQDAPPVRPGTQTPEAPKLPRDQNVIHPYSVTPEHNFASAHKNSRPSASPSRNYIAKASPPSSFGWTGPPRATRPGTTGKAGAWTVAKGGAPAKPGTTGKPAATTNAAASHAPPGKTVALKSGGNVSIRLNGEIRSIDKNGMHIEHGMHGGRTVVSEHNGARIVTTDAHGGYVQRPYVVRGGHTYVSRTYVVNGRSYSRVYRSYYYGGHPYYDYYPAYYYNPGFYGWAYNPWPAPIVWRWGWGGAPWYGYYGGYFAPYPVYPAATFWLTDYLTAANLQAAYSEHAAASAAVASAVADQASGDAAASDSAPAALTPEAKQAIAEEVKAQLAAELVASEPAAAGGAAAPAAAFPDEIPPALDPAHTTFVISDDLTVTAGGQECELTAGDVITRTSNTPDSDQKVTAVVTSSKKTDCAQGKTVAVSVDDLQEMHNRFQEQIDDGLMKLASIQGTGGVPKAPDTTTVSAAVPPPPPDLTATKLLQDQRAAADAIERQTVMEIFKQSQ